MSKPSCVPVHGPAYVTIGLVAETIDYTWGSYEEQTTTAAPTMVEAALATLGEEVLFVDVGTAVSDGQLLPADTPAEIGHPAQGVGILEDHWDGLLWLRQSGSFQRP